MTELRSNILKVRPDHANRCVIVGDMVLSRPAVIRNYTTDIPAVTGIYPDGRSYRTPKNQVVGTREFNKDLCERLGLPPKKWAKVFNGVAHEVWFKPIEWYVSRLARGMHGRVEPEVIERIWKHKPMLDQARKDGIENIVPVLLALERSPEFARKKLGRAKWRRLANNSFSRNRLLCRYSLEAMNLPSTAIPYMLFARWDVEALEWACRNRVWPLKDKAHITQLAQHYTDTDTMASRLGEPFNPKWSRRRMLEEHDRLSKAITLGRYSDKPFDLHAKIGDLVVEEEGWTATWLKSPAEVAEEGNTMRHCVASYSFEAARNEYAIFSIRDPLGERYSTLGLHIRPDSEGRMCLVQHDQHWRAMNMEVDNPTANMLATKTLVELKDRLKALRMAA